MIDLLKRKYMCIAILSIATGLTSLASSPLGAQSFDGDTTSSASAPEPSDSITTPAWVTKREALGLGLSIVATIAVAPLDKPVASEFQETRWQENEPLHSAAQALAFAGGPGPFLLGAGFFAVGKIGGSPPLATAGVHVTEAVLLAAAINGLGKGFAGRALPGVKTAENFEFGRGFHKGNGGFVSFPSGHTAAAFAMASALTGEASTWNSAAARYVGPFAYATATGIAVARLYQHVHWVSDLPLAAVIGTWSGLTIEGRAHASTASRRRRTAVARVLTAATLGGTADGSTTLGWSVPYATRY